MATACSNHYSLHLETVISYLKGEYDGKNRNVSQILRDVYSHVNKTDTAHIERILSQDGHLRPSFKETSVMKAVIIQNGNQATFKMHPEIVTKTMNKEDRHSHLLPETLGTPFLSLVSSHSPGHIDLNQQESLRYF
jgi:hypothetical protein